MAISLSSVEMTTEDKEIIGIYFFFSFFYLLFVKAAFTGKLAAYSNTLVQLLSFLFQLVVTFTLAVTSAIAATTTSSTSSSVTTAYNFNRLLLLLYFSRFFYGVNHLIRQITVKLSIP